MDSYEAHWRRRLVTIAARDYDTESDDFAGRIDAQVAVLTAWLTAPALGSRAFAHETLNPQSHTEISDFLGSTVLADSDADDVLVLYVTGHGIRGGSGNHFLVLPDSDEEDPLNTCYPTAELLSKMLSGDAEHIVIIVDSCHAGALHSEWATKSMDLKPLRRDLETLTVLASADFDEKPRIGEFAELMALVHERLRGPAQITNPYLTFADLFGEIRSVRTQRPELGQPKLIWLPAPYRDEGTPCLPNPGYTPPTDVVDHPRHQVAMTPGELEDYWTSRASGRATRHDRGWYFSGRTALMHTVVNFLKAAEVGGILIVTGVAGSGKSAILARAVTLSDPTFRDSNPDILASIEPSTLPPRGCIDVAVLAREKDTEQFCLELLELLGGEPTSPIPVFDDLKAHLSSAGSPVLIVVDGVDEATHPGRLVTEVLGPLARIADSDGNPLVRLLLGVRSEKESTAAQNTGRGMLDLLNRAAISASIEVLRTDDTPAVTDDIAAYLAALLNDRGPYAGDISPADAVAQVIASHVEPSFLDARLAGQRLRDASQRQNLEDPAWLHTLTEGTLALFREDLKDTAHAIGRPITQVLVVLRAVAFARGRGLPWADIWPATARAILDQPIDEPDALIAAVLHGRLVGYLAQDTEDGRIVHRPNHARLAEELRDHAAALLGHHHEPAESRHTENAMIHRRIAAGLAALIDHSGLTAPHPYLARHLLDHAREGGVLDDDHVPAAVLAWEPRARVRGLLGIPPRAEISGTRLAAWARIEPYLADAKLAARRMSLAFACASLGVPLPNTAVKEPLSTVSADWRLPPGNVLTTIELGSFDPAALAVCSFPDGRTIVAVACNNTVQLWDPVSGTQVGEPLCGTEAKVTALATLELPDGRPLLITGDFEGRLRRWDPVDGTQVGEPLRIHDAHVTALTTLGLPGVQLLASADIQGVVRRWDPVNGTPVGEPIRVFDCVGEDVRSLVTAKLPDGRVLLASASSIFGAVRLWDPVTGTSVGVLSHGHEEGVPALATLELPDGRVLLATGGFETGVRLWDPVTCMLIREIPLGRDEWVTTLTTLRLPDGKLLLAGASGNDGTLRLWDPVTGTLAGHPLRVHDSQVQALCALRTPGGRTLLASSANEDGTVRLTDPVADILARGSTQGHRRWATPVLALLGLPNGRVLVAIAGNEDGTVRLWDPIADVPVGEPLQGREGSPILAMTTVELPDGRVRLPPDGGHRDSGMNSPAGRMSPCPEPVGRLRLSTRSRPLIG